MKRRFTSRLLGALLAPWFAFVVAEPVSMHACAMHSGHREASEVVSTAAAHGVDHGQSHASAHVAADATQTEAPAPSDQHPCNCMGMGCQAPAVPLPSAQFTLVEISTNRATSRGVPPTAFIHRASQRDHDRPFAIGPPALRT